MTRHPEGPGWFIEVLVALTIGTAVFGVVALAQPSLLAGTDPGPAGRSYAAMYAARAIPLAVGLIWTLLRHRPAATLLWIAAATQFGDALIGLTSGQAGQLVAPAVVGLCYLFGALNSRAAHRPRSGESAR